MHVVKAAFTSTNIVDCIFASDTFPAHIQAKVALQLLSLKRRDILPHHLALGLVI